MKHVYELMPVDGRKSFYGKCQVETVGRDMYLWSYETCVARIRAGKFERLWSGYSDTTKRHVNAFRAFYGMETINKKEWEALPVCR